MKERITFISLFNEKNLEKITKYTNLIKEETCKVPFGKNVLDRMASDTLPHHFTIFACDRKKENIMLEHLKNIKIPQIKVLVDKLEIWTGAENSYVLVFHVEKNNDLKMLQQSIYEVLGSKKYNPEVFEFHITMDISQDKEKMTQIKKKIEENFKPFYLEIDTYGLFEIYPAKLISTYKNENKIKE